MLPEECSSGSTCHRRFLYGQYKIFERLWTRLAKTAYDAKVGIQ